MKKTLVYLSSALSNQNYRSLVFQTQIKRFTVSTSYVFLSNQNTNIWLATIHNNIIIHIRQSSRFINHVVNHSLTLQLPHLRLSSQTHTNHDPKYLHCYFARLPTHKLKVALFLHILLNSDHQIHNYILNLLPITPKLFITDNP